MVPNQSDHPAVEFEVLRPVEGVRPRLGRPLFLTARRFVRICHWIEQGQSAAVACKRELVTYQGFRRHVSRNPKYQRRLRQAEEVRDAFLREYHLANITRHAAENLSASLWYLEHKHPAEFSLRPFTRDSGDLEQQALCDKISLEQLVENAKLAREIEANPPPGLMPKQPDLPAEASA